MSSQHEETYWTLWQILNWIICRNPKNLPPWHCVAIEQVRAGLPDREPLPPLEIDPEQPKKGEFAIRNLDTGEVTEYSVVERLPVDSVVNDAEEALLETLRSSSLAANGRLSGNDFHDEIDALKWIELRFTDKQGARVGSTEFEDIRFLVDEIKGKWPEDSPGLLARHLPEIVSGLSQVEGSTTATRHDQPKNKGQRKADAEQGGPKKSLSPKERVQKDEIENVLRMARQKWPKAKTRPEVRKMARELLAKRGDETSFKFEAVRKILDGTYGPSQRLNIAGL